MISFDDMITREMPEIMLNDNTIYLADTDVLLKIDGGNFSGSLVCLNADDFLRFMRHYPEDKKYISLSSRYVPSTNIGTLYTDGILVSVFTERQIQDGLDLLEARRLAFHDRCPDAFLYHRSFRLAALDPTLIARVNTIDLARRNAHHAEETRFILDGVWKNANGRSIEMPLLDDPYNWSSNVLPNFCFCEIIKCSPNPGSE